MAKVQEMAIVLEQRILAEGVYSMWLSTSIAKEAVPGQFVSLYCEEHSRLLPRPISICEIDKERSAIRLVYRLAGEGTKEFSALQTDDEVKVLGPLGNGFPLEGEHPIVIGGGIGVPPMLELAKSLSVKATIVLGYRDEQLFLKEQFEDYGQVEIATDNGAVGVHGTVVDVLEQKQITGDVIYACGPKPMLAAVKRYAMEHEIKCYVSMEERMACGIGACLGCVCQTKEEDAHSHVHNTRVCKDGPVFLAEEVEL
ncbi:MAG: dihydroorotate dehydrogenase electron transfer subunit [Lachnospiraceae bacterium]|nr:dihydroorotate dehydrogenase electron transfer subunit [Lachnospiraceae bacterium]